MALIKKMTALKKSKKKITHNSSNNLAHKHLKSELLQKRRPLASSDLLDPQEGEGLPGQGDEAISELDGNIVKSATIVEDDEEGDLDKTLESPWLEDDLAIDAQSFAPEDLDLSTFLPPKIKNASSENLPARQNALDAYIHQIQRYALLTKEEERELALLVYEHNDIDAAQKLVTHNLRFVVKIAHEYSRYGLKIMDLIQEGNIGLMRAVKDFNPHRNVNLTTYAVWWIRSYIQDYVLKSWSLVKIGTTNTQRKLFYGLNREKQKMIAQGFNPSEVQKLARTLDVREKDVIDMEQRLSGRDVSLNQPYSVNNQGTMQDTLPDLSPSFEEELEQEEISQIIANQFESFAEKLNEKERYVFEHRLLSENPVKLHVIGEKFNISKERIRQIENNVKIKLREYIHENAPELELNFKREE